MLENIFYFSHINRMGGTEQFLYEIAKKYHKYDITIFYKEADNYQLKRLRQYVRCQRYVKGQKIKCNKAFFSYTIDMIDDVEANEYWFVSHAIYQELGIKPPIDNPKLTNYMAVSDYANKKLREIKDVDVKTCINPMTLEKPNKVIRLISAARLDDRVKGGDRTLKLIEAMDEYCKKNDRQYLWLIFTNPLHSKKITSPNVCIMKPRTDIRHYIADSDYLVQLSNDMETYCYSINEALGYGVKVVSTPLSILNELPINDDMVIKLNYDLSNIDDVVKDIFESKSKKFKYDIPNDNWLDYLSLNPSTYQYKLIKVKATGEYKKHKITDKELGYIPSENSIWYVTPERLDELIEYETNRKVKLVEVIEE